MVLKLHMVQNYIYKYIHLYIIISVPDFKKHSVVSIFMECCCQKAHNQLLIIITCKKNQKYIFVTNEFRNKNFNLFFFCIQELKFSVIQN